MRNFIRDRGVVTRKSAIDENVKLKRQIKLMKYFLNELENKVSVYEEKIGKLEKNFDKLEENYDNLATDFMIFEAKIKNI
jgi:archaellum component FlaC